MTFPEKILKYGRHAPGGLYLITTSEHPAFAGFPESRISNEDFESLLSTEICPIKVASQN